MKKIVAFILAASMLILVAGCSAKPGEVESQPESGLELKGFADSIFGGKIVTMDAEGRAKCLKRQGKVRSLRRQGKALEKAN